MNNIKINFLSAVKTFAAVVVIGFSIGKAQGVFITEIADPGNDAGARFVELYNSGSTDIDLGAGGYKVQRWTNGNSNPTASSIKDLTGVIPAGGFYILAPGDGSAFSLLMVLQPIKVLVMAAQLTVMVMTKLLLQIALVIF